MYYICSNNSKKPTCILIYYVIQRFIFYRYITSKIPVKVKYQTISSSSIRAQNKSVLYDPYLKQNTHMFKCILKDLHDKDF